MRRCYIAFPGAGKGLNSPPTHPNFPRSRLRRERLRRGPSGPRPSGPTASGRAPSGRRASGARPPAEESLDEQWRIITIPLSSPLSTVRWFLLPPYSTQALESGV